MEELYSMWSRPPFLQFTLKSTTMIGLQNKTEKFHSGKLYREETTLYKAYN